MKTHSEIAPDTLPVRLTEDGVEVQYTDGRSVYYRGVPTKAAESVKAGPGKDVHVLVTDESETEGVLVYVNERTTEDEILDASGVGRVLLDQGERTTIFPGVSATEKQMRVEVEVDFDLVDGRVFVFVEDEMGERSFEVVEANEASN